jgi:hypothetical protein
MELEPGCSGEHPICSRPPSSLLASRALALTSSAERAVSADPARRPSALRSSLARRAQRGHYALVPPLDRRALEAALIAIPLPMIGGALLASGATTAAVVVLGAAAMVAIVGGMRVWRTRR